LAHASLPPVAVGTNRSLICSFIMLSGNVVQTLYTAACCKIESVAHPAYVRNKYKRECQIF
jgi:hypothetical protein